MICLKSICWRLLSLLLVSITSYADVLTIGTLSYNPPFETFTRQGGKQGEFFGFEIDIMQEICKRIQRQCKFKAMFFPQLFSSLETQEIDLAIGSIIITPERRKHHLFSLPYKASYLQFIILKNAPFTAVPQLAGKRVGVYEHSPTADFARQQLNGDIQLKRFPGSMDMLYALERGQVDALLTNYVQTVYWVSNSNAYQLLGHKYLFEDGYGIMTRLGQDALIQRVNQALLAMEQDGTYLKIYQDSF